MEYQGGYILIIFLFKITFIIGYNIIIDVGVYSVDNNNYNLIFWHVDTWKKDGI